MKTKLRLLSIIGTSIFALTLFLSNNLSAQTTTTNGTSKNIWYINKNRSYSTSELNFRSGSSNNPEYYMRLYNNQIRFTSRLNSSASWTNDLLWDKDGLRIQNKLAVGTETMITGAVAHFDGRVYISEDGGSEEGFGAGYSGKDEYKDYLLWVEEGIVSTDFALAQLPDWPDYVFEDNYQLKSLSQVESFIKANGHLPTMPTASQVATKGFTVGNMTKRMVQTIEELTLHTIEQENKIKDQDSIIESLLERIEKLEKSIDHE